MSQPIKNYSDRELQQLFDHDSWQAALVLQQAAAVSDLRFVRDGAIITAQVTNRSNEICSVYIEIDGKHVDGDCNCSHGANCEHVAATLLEARQWDSHSHDSPASQRKFRRSSFPTPDSAEIGSQCVIYILKLNPLHLGSALLDGQTISITPYVSAIGSPGHDFLRTSDLKQLHPERFLNALYPRYVAVSDQEILSRLSSSDNLKCLNQCLETGRCYWDLSEACAEPEFQMPSLMIMRHGPTVVAEIEWQTNPDCTQQIVMQLRDQPLLVLISNPLLYLNIIDRSYGEISLPGDLGKFLTNQPALTSEQADRLRAANRWDKSLMPKPVEFRQVEADCISAKLILKSVENRDYAQISICYDGTEFSYGTAKNRSSDFRYVDGNTVYQFSRNHAREQQLLAALNFLQETESADDFLVASSSLNWLLFVSETLPKLVDLGWEIECEQSFRYQVKRPTSWHIEINREIKKEINKEIDWFSMSLNITVDDVPINILPSIVSLLNSYLSKDPLQWEHSINQGMWSENISGDEIFLPIVDTNTFVAVPLTRFKRILDTIVELYDAGTLDGDGNLAMSFYQISRTLTLIGEHGDHSEEVEFEWHAPAEVESILTTLQRSSKPFGEVPDSFSGTLRTYQNDGVNWMMMLTSIGFGGILADDMGLGKTIQTLAFLCCRKIGNSNPLRALIVVPTSLLGNWRQEAAKFAPSLKWLTLHGQKRKQWLSKAHEYDVVVTTYQTLLVDADWFLQQEYQYLILDEAQVIKNPRTQIAKMAKKIDAKVRFCLTGTPMENHLGELWSLFDFLMPGFLGNINAFSRHYRVPIEQQNMRQRKKALSQRIAPFLLRRTKDTVARELPKKTEIIQRVELTEEQRDLYESIRIAMHKDVLRIFKNNTLHQNRLSVLDALLKLRQVCCDPRLLREDLRKGVKQSAKLDLLMHLVEELLQEGRSAIIFSQFTSMLTLIGNRLDKNGINYDCLTGQSRNREQLVDSFQRGSFPVFLISLKAGGVGLNLTRADTVIHYDPWWNPAVESQATDRTHRIGQDKPVFVYKLIAEMTVEEKILQLQDRKRNLVDDIYRDHENRLVDLQGEDLLHLFEPML